jgi:hypothetical protein
MTSIDLPAAIWHGGGQGFESPQLHAEVFTFWWGLSSRLPLTFRLAPWGGLWLRPCRVRFVAAWWLAVCLVWFPGVLPLCVVAGGVRWLVSTARPGLGRCRGERGEYPAAPAAGFRGQALGGAALVFLLPGVPGGEDALVADGEQGRGEQHEGGQAHQAAPAAADVVGGGVLGGGEAAFGAGAAGIRAVPGRGRIVVFLRGLGQHVRRDGDGLLGAAGLRVLRGLQDLGPVPVQPHRGGAERAADLAHGGGALDPVVWAAPRFPDN